MRNLAGKFYFDNFEIEISLSLHQMRQGIDGNGLINAIPNGHFFTIEVRTNKGHSEALFSWLVRQEMKYAKAVFSPVTGNGKSYTFEFYDSFLLSFIDSFDNRSGTEAIFTLSAGTTVINGEIMHQNHWRVTDVNLLKQAPKSEVKLTPKITSINWIDHKTKEKIQETTYSNTIVLAVKIANPKSGTATIKIEKEDGSEFETGQKSFTYVESVDEDGVAEVSEIEIKQQWEEFKTADIDKLVAKVDYKGAKKTSKPLEVVPPPKVIVDFRPSKNYAGEYGFDYMRDKDKKDKLSYKDILGTNKEVNNTFTKYTTDAKYNSLKDNHYKTITYPWYVDKNKKEIEYIQSWLTIYPKQKVIVSLEIETIENVKKEELCLEYNSDYFTLNKDSIPGQSKGKKRLKDFLEIACIKAFDTDQTIKVSYGERQLGQLNIVKNSKANQHKAQVVFVKVKTNLKGPTDFLDGNTTGEETYLKKYLKQALVNLDLVEDEFNLTETDANGDLLYPDFNTDYTLLNSKGVKILNKYNNTTGKDNLVTYMEKIYNAKCSEFKDNYKIFFFGDRGGRKIYKKATVNGRTKMIDTGKIKGLGGYAKDIKSKSVAVFSGRGKTDVTHELLHAMSLHHSFSNTASFGYKKKATKNIMDYSTKKNNTWFWQWKQLWQQADLKKE